MCLCGMGFGLVTGLTDWFGELWICICLMGWYNIAFSDSFGTYC